VVSSTVSCRHRVSPVVVVAVSDICRHRVSQVEREENSVPPFCRCPTCSLAEVEEICKIFCHRCQTCDSVEAEETCMIVSYHRCLTGDSVGEETCTIVCRPCHSTYNSAEAEEEICTIFCHRCPTCDSAEAGEETCTIACYHCSTCDSAGEEICKIVCRPWQVRTSEMEAEVLCGRCRREGDRSCQAGNLDLLEYEDDQG